MALAPKLPCVIDKDRYIYDKHMPHLQFDIEDVQVGDRLLGMIVDNRLDKKDPCLVLTLQNSKI